MQDVTMSTQSFNVGECIRHLRKERGFSLESLAMEADLTTLALSNIELRSVKPQRDNLLKILTVLDKASSIKITDRRRILGAFGYEDLPSLPNELDISRAVKTWQAPFGNSPYPAYLVDISQRVHAWNGRAVLLLGERVEHLGSITLFDLMFAPFSHQLKLINADEVIFKTVAHIANDWHTFKGQSWCEGYIAQARGKYPRFEEILEKIAIEEVATLDVSAMEPVILQSPTGRQMQFRVVGMDMVSDPRFRIVQYIPLDTTTTQELEILAAQQ